jgi:hypothetical protein
MSKHHDSASHTDQAPLYEIRLKGHLGREWADWFGGMAIDLTEDGHTLLTGPVADQAALHGLLKKVRDLGLPLLAVQCVEQDDPSAHVTHPKKENQP